MSHVSPATAASHHVATPTGSTARTHCRTHAHDDPQLPSSQQTQRLLSGHNAPSLNPPRGKVTAAEAMHTLILRVKELPEVRALLTHQWAGRALRASAFALLLAVWGLSAAFPWFSHVKDVVLLGAVSVCALMAFENSQANQSHLPPAASHSHSTPLMSPTGPVEASQATPLMHQPLPTRIASPSAERFAAAAPVKVLSHAVSAAATVAANSPKSDDATPADPSATSRGISSSPSPSSPLTISAPPCALASRMQVVHQVSSKAHHTSEDSPHPGGGRKSSPASGSSPAPALRRREAARDSACNTPRLRSPRKGSSRTISPIIGAAKANGDDFLRAPDTGGDISSIVSLSLLAKQTVAHVEEHKQDNVVVSEPATSASSLKPSSRTPPQPSSPVSPSPESAASSQSNLRPSSSSSTSSAAKHEFLGLEDQDLIIELEKAKSQITHLQKEKAGLKETVARYEASLNNGNASFQKCREKLEKTKHALYNAHVYIQSKRGQRATLSHQNQLLYAELEKLKPGLGSKILASSTASSGAPCAMVSPTAAHKDIGRERASSAGPQLNSPSGSGSSGAPPSASPPASGRLSEPPSPTSEPLPSMTSPSPNHSRRSSTHSHSNFFNVGGGPKSPAHVHHKIKVHRSSSVSVAHSDILGASRGRSIGGGGGGGGDRSKFSRRASQPHHPILPVTQLKGIDENAALKLDMARADIKYRSDPRAPLPSEDIARYLSKANSRRSSLSTSQAAPKSPQLFHRALPADRQQQSHKPSSHQAGGSRFRHTRKGSQPVMSSLTSKLMPASSLDRRKLVDRRDSTPASLRNQIQQALQIQTGGGSGSASAMATSPLISTLQRAEASFPASATSMSVPSTPSSGAPSSVAGQQPFSFPASAQTSAAAPAVSGGASTQSQQQPAPVLHALSHGAAAVPATAQIAQPFSPHNAASVATATNAVYHQQQLQQAAPTHNLTSISQSVPVQGQVSAVAMQTGGAQARAQGPAHAHQQPAPQTSAVVPTLQAPVQVPMPTPTAAVVSPEISHALHAMMGGNQVYQMRQMSNGTMQQVPVMPLNPQIFVQAQQPTPTPTEAQNAQRTQISATNAVANQVPTGVPQVPMQAGFNANGAVQLPSQPMSDASTQVCAAQVTANGNGAATTGFIDENPLVMEAYDRTLMQEALRTNSLVPIANSADGAEAIIRFLRLGDQDTLAMALRDNIGTFVSILSKNEHGSSVVLKIFEIGDLNQRTRFWAHLRGKFLDLIVDPVGHRVVIQAMFRGPDGSENEILTEVKQKMHKVACNEFGSKVLLAVINPKREGRCEAAIDTLRGHLNQKIKNVARSPYGSSVVASLIANCPRSHKSLMPALTNAGGELLLTEPGAVVLTAMVEFGSDAAREEFVDAHVRDALLLASCNESGSRVVSACMTHGSSKARRSIAEESLRVDADGENLIVVRMLRDHIGVRVVQRLLELAPEELRVRLVDALRGVADVSDVCRRHEASGVLKLLNLA